MRRKAPALPSASKSILLTLFILVMSLLAWSEVGMAAQNEPDSELEFIAKQFYPERLRSRESFDAIRADLDGTGTQNYIIAAYIGEGAAIRVIKKSGFHYVLANDPEIPIVGTEQPTLELKDLDKDGKPEIILTLPSFAARGRSGTWVFRWDGTKLSPIGHPRPMMEGFKELLSAFAEPEYFDLNLDGIVEIIQPDYPNLHADYPQDEPTKSFDVYSPLTGKKLTTLLMFNLYWTPSMSAKETPKGVNAIVFTKDINRDYLLNIVNTAGGAGIYGADIYLNDIKILDHNNFPQSGARLSVTVHLKKKNLVTLKNIDGPYGGTAIVTIEPKQ